MNTTADYRPGGDGRSTQIVPAARPDSCPRRRRRYNADLVPVAESVPASVPESAHLKKALGPVMLWALGVGYVISGMYFGWNLGLPVGGPYGLLAATILVTILYVTFVMGYAELACALPRAGGAFIYARRAMGPAVGFLAGAAQWVEFVFAMPAIAVSIGADAGLLGASTISLRRAHCSTGRGSWRSPWPWRGAGTRCREPNNEQFQTALLVDKPCSRARPGVESAAINLKYAEWIYLDSNRLNTTTY